MARRGAVAEKAKKPGGKAVGRIASASAAAPATRAALSRAAPDDGPDEEDEDTEEERKARPPEKNYITPAGYRKMTLEFDFLRAKKRPEVVSALADAAAEGDRSENAEYIYRKKQLREIDRRLRFLAKRLDLVVIVDPREQKRRDRVFFGATVSVEDEAGESVTYRIVGADETDGPAGDISWRSPVGNALIGKALGETITVSWHAGQRELTIAKIDYL
jgi:transcription elongation factor GreB